MDHDHEYDEKKVLKINMTFLKKYLQGTIIFNMCHIIPKIEGKKKRKYPPNQINKIKLKATLNSSTTI